MVGTGSLDLVQDQRLRRAITTYYHQAYIMAVNVDQSRESPAHSHWLQAVSEAVDHSPLAVLNGVAELTPDETARIVGLVDEPGWANRMRAVRTSTNGMDYFVGAHLKATDELIERLKESVGEGPSS